MKNHVEITMEGKKETTYQWFLGDWELRYSSHPFAKSIRRTLRVRGLLEIDPGMIKYTKDICKRINKIFHMDCNDTDTCLWILEKTVTTKTENKKVDLGEA